MGDVSWGEEVERLVTTGSSSTTMNVVDSAGSESAWARGGEEGTPRASVFALL